MTEEDLQSVVAIHERAFSDSLNVSLGRQYLGHFFKWFINQQNAMGIVIIVEDSIVGYCIGAEDGYRPMLVKDLFIFIISALLSRPWTVFHKKFLVQLIGLLPKIKIQRASRHLNTSELEEIKPSMFVLVGIGIDAQMQGRGLGKKLLSAFEKLVWSQSYHGIRLTVYRDNYQAQSLYQSRNWSLTLTTGNSLKYTIYRQDTKEPSLKLG